MEFLRLPPPSPPHGKSRELVKDINMSEREKHANTLALTLPTSKLFYLFRDKNYTIFVCLFKNLKDTPKRQPPPRF